MARQLNLQHPVIAVMQPYLFPYLGYFQLIYLSDIFVFFDDVQFIRRGWINRNRILVQGKPFTFTVPVPGLPRETKIMDYRFIIDKKWKDKFFKTLESNYKKAPFFDHTMEIITQIFQYPDTRLVPFIVHQFERILDYLGISRQFLKSSQLSYNRKGSAEEKIISICKILKARTYVNPEGGSSLYSPRRFEEQNIQLYFLTSRLPEYPQYGTRFVPGLSIIDVLMWNPVSKILEMLEEFDVWQ